MMTTDVAVLGYLSDDALAASSVAGIWMAVTRLIQDRITIEHSLCTAVSFKSDL